MKDMNAKELKLAAEMLGIASDDFSRHICNDVDESFYEGWTIDERRDFVKQIHEWNGDPEDYDQNFLHTTDWVLMRFLASKLSTDPWIKVSERLPEMTESTEYGKQSEPMLCLHSDGHHEDCVLNESVDFKGESFWTYVSDGEICDTVTHWMPKPTAPKD